MDPMMWQTLPITIEQWMLDHIPHMASGFSAAVGLSIAAKLMRRQQQPQIDGWGSARFSEKGDIDRAGLFRRDGVVVGYAYGKHLRVGGDKHFLFVGPSGSGKSVLIRKTLKTYQESVVCLGKSLDETVPSRRKFGRVFTFDPILGGDHLNPWDLIAWGNSGKEISGIQRMTDHLTYTEAGDKRVGAERFYLGEAKEAFWALIPYVKYSRVVEASFGGLHKFLSVSGQEIKRQLQAMLDFGQPSPHPTVFNWANQVIHKTVDVLDKTWSAARSWLSQWVDPSLAWNTHDTTIDVNSFQQGQFPATLYLNIAVEDLQGRLRSFTRMLLDMISLKMCDRREKDFIHDVLWVLDDMPELRYLPLLDRLPAYLRGFGHFLLGGAQSFLQLWQWLGQYTAIRNNAGVWVMFAPMDDEEARTIEGKLGEMTVLEPSSRRGWSGWTRSVSSGVQSHRRSLMTAFEIGNMTEEQLLVCVRGYAPIMAVRGPMEIAA